MPGFLQWMFIAVFFYGACLLTWAGLKQRKKGKMQSARYFLIMGGFLAVVSIIFLTRKLLLIAK